MENAERSELDVILGKTEKVETKKGTVTVRELVVEDIAGLTDALTVLFKDVDFEKAKSISSASEMMGVFTKGGLLTAIKRLLTVVTDSPEGFFDRFPVVDTLKVVAAFFRVNDWDELKKLFFELRRLFQKDVVVQPTK